MNSKKISLGICLAVLYAVLTLALGPLSYGTIQIRIADVLYPLIGLLGIPALFGLILGHAVANIFSPLGIIDMLSVLMTIPAKLLIFRFKFKGVPFHVLTIALWVPLILCLAYGLPFELYPILVLQVGIGETIAELILGRWLYLEIGKRIKNLEL